MASGANPNLAGAQSDGKSGGTQAPSDKGNSATDLSIPFFLGARMMAENSELSGDGCSKTKEKQNLLEQTYRDLMRDKAYFKQQIARGIWKWFTMIGKDLFVEDYRVSLWKYENSEVAKVEWKAKSKTGFQKFEVKDEKDKVVSSGILQMRLDSMSFIVENLQLGKKYSVKITTIRDVNTPNHDAAFDISTCPTSPTDIKISENDDAAICQWNPCEGAKSYKVEVENGKYYPVFGNVTTIPKSDYKTGHRYRIRIKAIGKEEEQETITDWTNFKTGNGKVPFNVEMRPGGYRQLHVNWAKPEKVNPKHYDLTLYYVDFNKMMNFTTQDTKFTFNDLPTDKSFYCTVQAVNDGGSKSSATESNKCMTSISDPRQKSYSISTKGKLTIFEPTLDYHKNPVRCELHWCNADIGEESKNFKLQKNNLLIVEDPDKGEKVISQTCNANVQSLLNCSVVQSIPLLMGKKYLVTVQAVYHDLDSLEVITIKAKRKFQTKIGEPSNINVRCEGENIIFTWDPAPGAEKYTILVKDKAANPCHDSKKVKSAKCEFTTNKKFRMGNKYNLNIKAEGNGMTTETQHSFTLGGNLVPTNLRAIQNPDDQCRSVQIIWEKPDTEKECTGYQCSIKYKNNSYTAVVKITKVRTGTLNYTFNKLKSDTEYFGQVVAIFADGQHSTICQSNGCKTDNAFRDENESEILLEKGKVKNIILTPYSAPDEVKYEVTWENGHIGNLKRHFTLDHTTLSISNELESKKEPLIQVQPDENNKATFSLKKGGTYLMKISTLFNDLDEEPNQTASHEQVIHTDIEKPQNIMAECKKGRILLSWNPVVGAKHYEVRVLDGLNTGVTLHSAQNQITDTKYVFDLNRKCGYGKTCKFQVTAIAFNGKKQTGQYDMIIGGNSVPTKVSAVADASCPHRRVKVAWNAPNNNQAIEYHVILLQGNAEKANISTFNTRVMFNHLQSATTYTAYVTEMFAGNVKSENCYSNDVQTAVNPADPHKGDATKNSKFGSPENLEYDVDISGDHPVAYLQWKRPHLGMDYKFTRYKITATAHNTAPQTFYLMECFETSKFELPIFKHGSEYTVTVTTEFLEIDNRLKYERETNVIFFTGISRPVINDPECSENEVTFNWSQSPGATSYIVEINDKANNEPVVSDRTNTNSFSAAIDQNKFFIGRSYIVKVKAERDKKMTSSQAVQEVFLGDEKVPRHVLPTKDIDDPYRTVVIQFDKPNANDGPEGYQVRAIPLSGKIRRILSCQDTAVKIRYLRSNTKYRFEITALYESGEMSLPSSSIWLKTEKKQSTSLSPAMMNMSDNTATLDYRGASFIQQNIAAPSSTISDTVCDIRTELTAESENTDKVSIAWQHPSFNRHPEDYKINSYKVELLDSHGNTTHDPVFVNPTQEENKAQFKGLRCGNKKYQVLIKTIYEDIDADTDSITSNTCAEDLFSRPIKPKISKNFPNAESQKLEIEWNPSEGANEYKLEILQDKKDKDPILEILDKNARQWSCPFSENIGFGSHYKIRLTATSVDGSSNSDETDSKTIGGNQVPKNSQARKNIETPNTKADISWEKPNAEPLYYLVEAFNGETCEKTSDKIVDETQHTMSELKPGTKYSFKVYAVYENTTSSEKKEENRSGGCLTNKITTRAAPSKIRKLNVELDKKNPSTSALMKWEADNQSDEPDGQLTGAKFQISLTCMNRKHYQEMLTVDKEFQLSGLDPGYTYEVTVTGGSDEGFGETSDPKSFTTNLGMPHDVKLMVNSGLPSASVVLNFAKAEGLPGAYLATLSNGLYLVNEKRLDPECSSVIFNENIEGNTEYHAEIQAHYVIENESSPRSGEKVKSNSVLTAPPKPQPPHVELIKENDKYKSGWIKISWNPLTKCNNHAVEIKKEGSEPEQTLMVTQKLSCQYQCNEEGNKYKVRMRSQNSSGYYGKWSEYTTMQLAPASLQHVEAFAQDNQIIVKWAKREFETEFLVQVYVDGNQLGQLIATRECSYAVAMDVERPSSTYSFGVWAEIDKLQGNMVKSNDVISKPAPGKLTRIARAKSDKGNEIVVSWKKHFCDFYQLEIKSGSSNKPENFLTVESKNEGNADELSCTYLCQCPGDTYVFRVRCHYKSVFGDWSEEKSFQTVPPKITKVESRLENNILSLAWRSVKIRPQEYVIKLYQNGECIRRDVTIDNKYRIDNLLPGKNYYSEISAKNECGIGESSKTDEHKTGWIKAGLQYELDQSNPSQAALLRWNKPEGVSCFKLVIQNKNLKEDTIPLEDCEYLFDRGIPGSVYEVRLHCGCDGIYDEDCTKVKLVMGPQRPVRVGVSRNEHSPSTSILVEIQDEIDSRKKYKVVAQPRIAKDKETSVTTTQCSTQIYGLTPGETYEVYVICICEDLCSAPTYSQPIQTYQRNTSYNYGNAGKILPQAQGSVGGQSATEHMGQENSSRKEIPQAQGRVGGQLASEHTRREHSSCKGLLVEATYNRERAFNKDKHVYHGILKGARGVEEEIVVKIIMFSKDEETEKLMREIRNLKILHHKNVVKYIFSNVCDHDEGFESIFIAMEKCDHKTLHDRITDPKQKPEAFNIAQSMQHIKGLCDGLQHIHESNIIHRDLKPQNILFRIREENGQKIEAVVICDFGLSKKLREGKTNTRISSTSRGTDGWRAPETYKKGKVSKKADIFSLGLVIYHILSNGQHPYGDNPYCWVGNIIGDQDKDFDKLCKFPSRELARNLIESMLDPDPAKRPCIEQVQQHPYFWDSQQKLSFYGDVIKYMELVGTKCVLVGKTSNLEEKGIEICPLDLDEEPSEQSRKALTYIDEDSVEQPFPNWKTCFEFREREMEDQLKICEEIGKPSIKKEGMQTKAYKPFQKCLTATELCSDSTKESNDQPTGSWDSDSKPDTGQPIYTLVNFIRNRHTHFLEDSRENLFHLTEEELWDFFSVRFPYLLEYVYKRFQQHYSKKCESDKDFTTIINRYFSVEKPNIEIIDK